MIMWQQMYYSLCPSYLRHLFVLGRQTFGLQGHGLSLYSCVHLPLCVLVSLCLWAASDYTTNTKDSWNLHNCAGIVQAYEPLILVYCSSECREWYSWLDSRNQLRTVCVHVFFCWSLDHTRIPLIWPYIYSCCIPELWSWEAVSHKDHQWKWHSWMGGLAN